MNLVEIRCKREDCIYLDEGVCDASWINLTSAGYCATYDNDAEYDDRMMQDDTKTDGNTA